MRQKRNARLAESWKSPLIFGTLTRQPPVRLRTLFTGCPHRATLLVLSCISTTLAAMRRLRGFVTNSATPFPNLTWRLWRGPRGPFWLGSHGKEGSRWSCHLREGAELPISAAIKIARLLRRVPCWGRHDAVTREAEEEAPPHTVRLHSPSTPPSLPAQKKFQKMNGAGRGLWIQWLWHMLPAYIAKWPKLSVLMRIWRTIAHFRLLEFWYSVIAQGLTFGCTNWEKNSIIEYHKSLFYMTSFSSANSVE